MNTEKFKRAYSETRNGANFFVRHPLVRKFQYSDGVQECADAGCHWMLDIAATELPEHLPLGDLGVLKVHVHKGLASMRLELDDDKPPVWARQSIHTDMPEGPWVFLVVNEGERIAFILPSEY